MHRATIGLIAALALVASGCATKEYVRTETGSVHTRVDSVEKQVEQNQTAIRDTNDRVGRTEEHVTKVSKTAQEALDRAEAAGKLAQGKLLYETVLTDSDVHFAFDKAELSDEAKAALDEFANDLKSRYTNTSVYIEIQGHTDSIGQDDYNEKLGLERAESVRRYLNKEHQLPLHRMSVISYGETEPIADNDTREGRAQNRRVVLVVLQ